MDFVPPKLSIIVPLYNEEESVPALYSALSAALEHLALSVEIIFVDDGSSDNTVQVATELTLKDPRLKVIAFRRNYGQTPAMAAGIDSAQGEILVTMDGDLQNDPADIPMMVDKLLEGYDIVVGWRHNRQDKLLSRKIPSVIANRLIGKVTGVPINDNGCSLKVYRSDVIKALPFYSEMHRFIPALLSLSGARIAEVKVQHHARRFGESKYGLSRTYKVLLDLLTMKTILSIARHPTSWFYKLSLLPFAVSLSSATFVGANALQGSSVIVMASLSTVHLFLGLLIIGLGYMCELIYQRSSIDIASLSLLTAQMHRSPPQHLRPAQHDDQP